MLNKIANLLIMSILLISTMTSCGIYKKSDARKVSPNVDERVKKAIEEGQGIRFGTGAGGKGTNFEFASSNELWRASLEVLDFLPLSNVDYSGGIIITDWYSDETTPGESIKISIRFLSNEIRADGINLTIHKKTCSTSAIDCKISKFESSLEEEIKLAILKKATILKKDSTSKNKKKT